MSTPKMTIAEWVALGLGGMSVGTHPSNWGLVPVLAIAGVSLYALRRSEGFRERIEDGLVRLEEMGAPERAIRTLKHLGVPPIGEQLARSTPRFEEGAKREALTRHNGLAGLRGLWGDDEPRASIRPQSRQTEIGPGRPRKGAATRRLPNPEGRVTTKMRALETDWLPQAEMELMPIRELCGTVNNDPDTFPFVIVFGPPRSGKTTLVQLIALTRPGKVVILDPKRPQGFKGPKWGGLPYISKDIDGSYQPMVDALTKGYKLMEWRYRHQETATKEFEPVTFVIDEVKTVVDDCPEIAELYRAILSKGAEARVRIVLTSTTDRARKLGFDGEADSLEGFVPIRLGSFAKRVMPEVIDLGSDPRLWAAVNFGEWQAFDNSTTAELLERIPMRPSKVWNKVQYNCQVPNWSFQDVGQPEVEQRQVRPRLASIAAKRETPTGWKTTSADDALLAEMFAKYGRSGTREVSNVLALEVTSEVSSADTSVGSTSGTTIGTSVPLSEKLHDAATLLKTASSEERSTLRYAAFLFTVENLSKTAAIKTAFQATGGPKFVRAGELIEAWKLLKEQGAK